MGFSFSKESVSRWKPDNPSNVFNPLSLMVNDIAAANEQAPSEVCRRHYVKCSCLGSAQILPPGRFENVKKEGRYKRDVS